MNEQIGAAFASGDVQAGQRRSTSERDGDHGQELRDQNPGEQRVLRKGGARRPLLHQHERDGTQAQEQERQPAERRDPERHEHQEDGH